MSFLRSIFGKADKGAALRQRPAPKAETEAELLRWVEQTEDEDAKDHAGVAPHPYERLAIMYRKRKDYKREVEILERYFRHRQAPGVKPRQLRERLTKARELHRQSGEKSVK